MLNALHEPSHLKVLFLVPFDGNMPGEETEAVRGELAHHHSANKWYKGNMDSATFLVALCFYFKMIQKNLTDFLQ